MSIISLLLLALFPQLTFAHTKLQSSVPEPDAIIVQEMKEVVMTFNTEVEPLSSFVLKQEDGTELPVERIEIIEDRIIGSFDHTIPNGAYTVEWKIVGRDGHPIKGDFQFTVNVPVEAVEEEPSQEPAPTATPAQTIAPSPEPSASDAPQENTTAQDSKEGRNQAGMWVIGGVVLIALFVIIWGARRKKQ